MKTNKGIAIKVWLVTRPNSLPAAKPRSEGLKMPKTVPIRANIRATPARVKATGYPAIRAMNVVKNMARGAASIMSRYRLIL